jgi:hypothetical protein
MVGAGWVGGDVTAALQRHGSGGSTKLGSRAAAKDLEQACSSLARHCVRVGGEEGPRAALLEAGALHALLDVLRALPASLQQARQWL